MLGAVSNSSYWAISFHLKWAYGVYDPIESTTSIEILRGSIVVGDHRSPSTGTVIWPPKPMAKRAPEPKRRKINQPPPRRIVSSSTADKARDVPLTSHTAVPVAQTSEIKVRIQQAKIFAVAQAQQEGCTGNFKIFDSPFGNFLVPVIPTRKELAG